MPFNGEARAVQYKNLTYPWNYLETRLPKKRQAPPVYGQIAGDEISAGLGSDDDDYFPMITPLNICLSVMALILSFLLKTLSKPIGNGLSSLFGLVSVASLEIAIVGLVFMQVYGKDIKLWDTKARAGVFTFSSISGILRHERLSHFVSIIVLIISALPSVALSLMCTTKITNLFRHLPNQVDNVVASGNHFQAAFILTVILVSTIIAFALAIILIKDLCEKIISWSIFYEPEITVISLDTAVKELKNSTLYKNPDNRLAITELLDKKFRREAE